MARRRMFCIEFLKRRDFDSMSTSAQMLYIRLCLEADDDGFVSNPQMIIRMSQSTNEDYEALLKNNFIIVFKSGVAAVRHWHLHNQIRKSRYTPTINQKEFELLALCDDEYIPIPSAKALIYQPPAETLVENNIIPFDCHGQTNDKTPGAGRPTNG